MRNSKRSYGPRWTVMMSLAASVGFLVLVLSGSACSRDDGLEFAEQREVWPSGLVIRDSGYLKDGKKHGAWYQHWGKRLHIATTWRNGVQHGIEFTYSLVNGLLLADALYVNGQQHGRTRIFGGNDNRLTSLSWWSRGLQDGFWCDWSDDGRLIKLQEYRQGDHIRTERPPSGACPYTSSELGAHHFDPDDRTYMRPYKQSSHRTRPIPLHR